MNQLTATGGILLPTTMREAMELAEWMAKGKMMPEHLRNAGDALMVVEQAQRWNMSPFAVAQATFSLKGRLGYYGTIVHAAVESSGAIQGLIDYAFNGVGIDRELTVSATRRGETAPRTVTVRLKDARTDNQHWAKQPDQQLCYHGVRVWARRWTPGVMLGVYSREELMDETPETYLGPTIDHDDPAQAPQPPVTPPVTPLVTPPPPPPPESKPLTVADRLDLLEADLQDALNAPDPATAVDAIIARQDVQKLTDYLASRPGPQRNRLNMIVKTALDWSASGKPEGASEEPQTATETTEPIPF